MGEESGVPVGLFFVLLYSEKKKMANEERMSTWQRCSHLQKVEAAKRKSCKNRLFLMTC